MTRDTQRRRTQTGADRPKHPRPPVDETWMWEPDLLPRFRATHGLSEAALVRLLNRYPGLELVNWGVVDDWERGVTPRAAYQAAIRVALADIENVLRFRRSKPRRVSKTTSP